MKTSLLHSSFASFASGLALAASLGLSGCKLPTTDARRSAQTVGLFQSIIDRAGMAHGEVSQQIAGTDGKIPEGKLAPGYPGFVYSPFTASPSLVDISSCRSGQKVCCPFTQKTFLVPAEKRPTDRQVAARKTVDSIRPPAFAMASTPVPFRAGSEHAEGTDELLKKLDLTNFGFFMPNVLADVGPGGHLPFGTRIKDKPGFVYSPYASHSQLVDVAGIAPGVDVSCPYTGKLFRVPEELNFASVP